MIRHTTVMITRRISDVRQCKFSHFQNRRIEIIANFVVNIIKPTFFNYLLLFALALTLSSCATSKAILLQV